MLLSAEAIADFVGAINDMEQVSGFTHDFYRYPARFSPKFAKTIIDTFTKPGEWIYDPFVGSGTSLVEASLSGRYSYGTDISSLAVFLSRVKTTCLTEDDILTINHWASILHNALNIRNPSKRDTEWITYQKNINGKKTWRIRKLLELTIDFAYELPNVIQQQFIRCVLLKTAQWALDCRIDTPTVEMFRRQFMFNLKDMIEKNIQYTEIITKHFGNSKNKYPHSQCINTSVIGADKNSIIMDLPKPALILTSPPYPGVHVLYHRWQVHSRKETPAPFWLANCYDGNPESYYTMGNRQEQNLVGYFEQLSSAFSSIRNVADEHTMIVQMVAFSDPTWQLEKYLKTMEDVGLSEIKYHTFTNSSDGRLWRIVPNRKWYAHKKGEIGSQKEVTLFHQLTK